MAYSPTLIYDVSDKEFTTFLDLEPESPIEIGPKGSILKAHSKKDPSRKRVMKLLLKKTPNELAKNRKAFFNAVQSIARLNHPNVVSDISGAVCPSFFVICTDFYPLGNLATIIPTIPRVAKEFYVSQIACAVYYIHCRGVVHLDLNPRHVLIDVHGNAVLSDFGSSRILLRPKNIIVRSGIDGYRAPEVCGSSTTGIDPFKADVYSVGAILWNMIFQMTPNEYAINYSLTVDEFLMREENSVIRNIIFGTMDPFTDRRWDSSRLVRELSENLPAMTNMINKLIKHKSLPPVTPWISTENLLQINDKNRS